MRTSEQRLADRQQREVRKALAFEKCPSCSYDLATGEGERSCHYYDCPYVPDLLDAVCPDCRYNFMTEEGRPACGASPCCTFALTEAPRRVETLTRWMALHDYPI
jgi:hypothetical protein